MRCAHLQAAGLRVIDISDPADPLWVIEYYPTGGSGLSVAVSGEHAYVADGYAGLQVIDISIPTDPQRVGGNRHTEALGAVAVGDYVYVAAAGQGLSILHAYKALAGPPLSFAAKPRVQADSFHFTVQGLTGIRVDIEESADLLNWQSWTNLILPTVPLELEQTAASAHPQQFFRAVVK